MLTIEVNGVSVSDFLDKYEVEIQEVFDEASTFTSINGKTDKVYLGDKREIAVDFEPMSEEQVSRLFNAIKSDREIQLKYIDPQFGYHSILCTCENLPAATYFEGEAKVDGQLTSVLFWTIPTITFVEITNYEESG